MIVFINKPLVLKASYPINKLHDYALISTKLKRSNKITETESRKTHRSPLKTIKVQTVETHVKAIATMGLSIDVTIT